MTPPRIWIGGAGVWLGSASMWTACSVLAVQVDGSTITTIQGLAGAGPGGTWHPVQTAFKECHGLQCGYCTPGMVLAPVDLLSENPSPSEQEIREGLDGRGGEVMTETVERSAAIGTPIRRKEDARLLTGSTQWTDTLTFGGELHM